LIEEVFVDREKIKLEEFSEIVEKVTSEMFLAVSRGWYIQYGVNIDRHSVAVFSPLQ
jgi:hypothetical protein